MSLKWLATLAVIMTLTSQMTQAKVVPINAAVDSSYSLQVRRLDRPKSSAIPVQKIEIESSQIPLRIHFKSRSSRLEVTHNHQSADGEIQKSRSQDEPNVVIHEVSKPIIQEIREIVQPYRKTLQEVRPVKEELKTVVTKMDDSVSTNHSDIGHNMITANELQEIRNSFNTNVDRHSTHNAMSLVTDSSIERPFDLDSHSQLGIDENRPNSIQAILGRPSTKISNKSKRISMEHKYDSDREDDARDQEFDNLNSFDQESESKLVQSKVRIQDHKLLKNNKKQFQKRSNMTSVIQDLRQMAANYLLQTGIANFDDNVKDGLQDESNPTWTYGGKIIVPERISSMTSAAKHYWPKFYSIFKGNDHNQNREEIKSNYYSEPPYSFNSQTHRRSGSNKSNKSHFHKIRLNKSNGRYRTSRRGRRNSRHQNRSKAREWSSSNYYYHDPHNHHYHYHH